MCMSNNKNWVWQNLYQISNLVHVHGIRIGILPGALAHAPPLMFPNVSSNLLNTVEDLVEDASHLVMDSSFSVDEFHHV
jgi:hypothetical protein